MRYGSWIAAAAICTVAAWLALTHRRPGEVVTPARAALTEADIQRIASRVERIRGLRFRNAVEPQFLTRAEATDIARKESEADYGPSQRRVDEEALKLIGLLEPDASLDTALKTIEGEQILGFYVPRTKRLVVVRDGSASGPLLEITLAHELTHALEDQHFDLGHQRSPTGDRSVAESALVEGSATEVMTRYAEEYLSPGQLLDVAYSSPAETKLPPYVENVLVFPYLSGQRFVEAFVGGPTDRRAGSWPALDSLYKGMRPATSEQVLHPRKFAFGEQSRHVTLRDIRRSAGPRWHRVERTSVGEFDVGQIFELLGDGPDRRAAEGWGGGVFELWRPSGQGFDGCRAPCIASDIGVLRVVWDSRRDRIEAQAQLARAIRKGLEGRPLASSGPIRLWSSRGGVIALSARDRTTTLVFAPTERLARAVSR